MNLRMQLHLNGFLGMGQQSDFVNTTHFYDSYGVYNVALVAMAEDGCTDTAYVAITVNDEVLFYVPNSFTPNGDGLNELFIPVLTAGYDRSQGYEFSVYNRWGEQIFSWILQEKVGMGHTMVCLRKMEHIFGTLNLKIL